MIQNVKIKALGAIGTASLVLIFGLLYAMDNQLDTDNNQEETTQDQANVNNTGEQESIPETEFFNEDEQQTKNRFDNNETDSTPFDDNTENSDQVLNDTQPSLNTNTTIPVNEESLPIPPKPATANQIESEQATILAPTANQLSLNPKILPFSSNNGGSNKMPKNLTLNIGLPESSRTEMANALQKVLADEYVLYTKTLNFHWNVEGKHFGPLHALFNDQYEKLQSIIDSVAERIRALGSFTHATMREFLSMASLTEKVNDFPDDMTMLSVLLADHESVIQTIRNANDIAVKINDGGSNNFLSGLLETHEKIAWILRAHLNK